jgi:hypothetical protein
MFCGDFLSCIFASFTNNIHIISSTYVIPLAFEHFISQLTFVKLMVQLHKCTTQLPSSLLLDFSPSTKFVIIWTTSWFWMSRLDLLLFLFLSIICIGQGCSQCKCAFEIRGCLNNFWGPLLVFHP